MSRIRILRLIARMNVGGPAQQIVGLQRRLDDGAFESLLVTGCVDPSEADHLELRAPDVEVVRLPALGRSVRLAGDARALVAVTREIERFQPQIVHTHTAKAGVIGRVAALRADVPITVHTFHGHLLRGYFSPLATAAITSIERSLARRTTKLLAVGERVRDDLLASGIGQPEQYQVLPPGVELPEPPPPQEQARRDLGLPGDAPVIAFVGRLTDVKMPLRVVAVARALAAAVPDVRFVIAGDGPLGNEMRRAAVGLPITFLGWRGDVHRIYAACDLVLLTSENEGMPVSLIEAALCGRAAVTTDVGSAREVVEDGSTGRVVPATAPQELATAVRELLADRRRLHEMGRSAHDRCAERFSMERLVQETESLYLQLMAASTERGTCR